MKKKARSNGEPQVPDYTLDFLEQEGHNIRPKKTWSTGKIVIICVIGVLTALIAGAGIWYWSVSSNPLSGFDTVLAQMTPQPATVQTPPPPGETAQPDATATPSPLDLLRAQADTSFLKDTVNILLIGVDHSEERDTEEWARRGGKQSFHADVMIVLAINTKTNAVNMISLPRDTYAQIPGVKGIYKLNASLDCGGGWPGEANGYSTGGFDKVCEAASWMLGGIPVKYYYAVDMNAVKGLVDAIGGVQNFEIEMDFYMQGRSYKKGVQPHMDGQAVLDYLRVRQNISESGDLNRINRQKKMLVAIFDRIKTNGLLTSIPGLIDSFEGNLYTNVPLAYTAGLALFAMNIDPDTIGMYSMGGRTHSIFNWNFVITDQKARVNLIRDIYGVTVEEYEDYAAPAATRLWEKMRTPVVKSQGLKALARVKAKLDADAALPVYAQPTPTPAPTPPPEKTPKPSAETPEPPAETPSPTSTQTGNTEAAPQVSAFSGYVTALAQPGLPVPDAPMLTGKIPSGYRQHLEDGPAWTLYRKALRQCERLSFGGSTASMQAANEQVINDVTQLCEMFGITLSKSYWRVDYEDNPKHNEVYVDFR